MDGALLMANKNIFDVGVHQGVKEIDDRAAGESKNNFHSFFLKASYNSL